MRTLSLMVLVFSLGCSGENLTGVTGGHTATSGGSSTGGGTSGGQGTSGTSGVARPTFASITVDGGTLTDLAFAVVGDTRPAEVDDTAAYPSGIIDQIYADMLGVSPAPQFVIATGDYQYVQPGSGQSAPQIAQYVAAVGKYGAPLLAVMGNHECNGYSDSECGPNGADGITENYTTFLSQLVAPIGANTPYYAVPLSAADGSWNAKVVCIAANAWDANQSAWLTNVLKSTTTYTFVVQHEPSTDSSELSELTEINTVVATSPQPLTLRLVGHSHTFKVVPQVSNEVIVGNGGVADTEGTFGFALVARQSDGSIQLTQYDETSGMPTPGGVAMNVSPGGVVGG
jgi:Calcineurin-like phosphoesterase